MVKKIWVYDIETLSNCFTYTAMERETKEIVQYTIWKNINELNLLLAHLDSCKGLIGFNNLDFDYPVLHHILTFREEYKDLDADELTSIIYDKAQEVIQDQWSSIRPRYVKIPQLDLFKIWHYNNKARMTSLKKLQIAFRYHNVQDMPYKHYESIETKEQVQEILDYNLNDVDSTFNFYLKTLPKIELRKGLYTKYNLKCMNYSDSKIGEELMLLLYCNATGEKYNEVKKMRTNRNIFRFSECIPDYIDFKSDEANEMLSYLKGIVVDEIKGSFKHSFSLRQQSDFHYDLGTGGIHGCIKAGVYEESDTHMIVDVDVASYYPTLPVVMGLFPKHLGESFLEEYREGLIKPRFIAKGVWDKAVDLWNKLGILDYSKDKNVNYDGQTFDKTLISGFKLAMNSVYGKSNSEYSWLYDPLYTLKTTLAGQLSLVMLSEMLMENVDDMTMLQINTDGLTAIIPRTKKREFYKQCVAWENKTGLILEYVAYKQMIIRDVNSYISETLNGYKKYKGAFVTYSEMMKNDEYHKSLSQMIVAKAVADYFLDNIPVESTIMKCDNIYDFCKTFNSSHGWSCETISEGSITKRQKTNRYYVSNNGETFRKTKDDRIIEIEAGGNKVTIFNKFIEKKSILDYDINYNYYIAEAYKIIHKIDGTEERLLAEKKALKEQEKRNKEEEKFIKYCLNKRPTERQYGLYAKPWLLEKYSNRKILIK